MRIEADYARELDDHDELGRFRDEFVIDDPELIYLDGNSLGRLPKRAVARVREVVESEWGGRLVRGWNEGWFTLAQRVGAKIAQLIGARPDEVIVADSTSVNLFKLIVAALQARRDRRGVVTDDQNFPSDGYVLRGATLLPGFDATVHGVFSVDGISGSEESLERAVDSDIALVVLSHTAFKSGFVYDMARINELAHRAGALVLWDLCHSVGAMPLSLGASGADMAVGCTYKYLNGGPGAPAFLYVRRDLQEQLDNPIWGWFGHRAQFDFAEGYYPATDMRRFQTGTPTILSLAAVESGVDLLIEAGMNQVRAKSVRLTEYLISLWQELLAPLGVTLNSPRDPARRGSHVSFGHPDGLRIARALIEELRVVPDFRQPDNIRFGVSPLYTTFAEIHQAVTRFMRVISERLLEKYPAAPHGVT